MKRNDSIQILRGIAALLVVHLHSIFMVSQRETPSYSRLGHISGFGACGVDVFFSISGFILSTVAISAKRASPHGGFDFLLRRFIRIFPIYWILSTFFLLVAIKQHHLNVGLSVDSYLLMPSMRFPMPAPLIFVGWTLIFEMFFYYLIAFNLFFGRKLVIERTIGTIVLLVAMGSWIGIQRPFIVLISNPINLEFGFGCVIAVAFAKYGRQQRLGTILVSSGTLLLLLTLLYGNPAIADNKQTLNGALSWYRLIVWGLPAAMVTGGLAFRETHIRSRFGRLAVFVGDASYSIYLISLIVFFCYDRLYPHFSQIGPAANVLISCMAVAVTGSICYVFLERPITRFLASKYHHIAVQSAP